MEGFNNGGQTPAYGNEKTEIQMKNYTTSSDKKASEIIIELQNKNANLRMGLGKLLKICEDTKQHLVSPVWMQQIGFAKQMFTETDPNVKDRPIPLNQ